MQEEKTAASFTENQTLLFALRKFKLTFLTIMKQSALAKFKKGARMTKKSLQAVQKLISDLVHEKEAAVRAARRSLAISPSARRPHSNIYTSSPAADPGAAADPPPHTHTTTRV